MASNSYKAIQNPATPSRRGLISSEEFDPLEDSPTSLAAVRERSYKLAYSVEPSPEKSANQHPSHSLIEPATLANSINAHAPIYASSPFTPSVPSANPNTTAPSADVGPTSLLASNTASDHVTAATFPNPNAPIDPSASVNISSPFNPVHPVASSSIVASYTPTNTLSPPKRVRVAKAFKRFFTAETKRSSQEAGTKANSARVSNHPWKIGKLVDREQATSSEARKNPIPASSMRLILGPSCDALAFVLYCNLFSFMKSSATSYFLSI